MLVEPRVSNITPLVDSDLEVDCALLIIRSSWTEGRGLRLEARVGIEPTHEGFADLSLTAWVPRLWAQNNQLDSKTSERGCPDRPGRTGILRLRRLVPSLKLPSGLRLC
jgi:hypothetical protein